MTICSCEFEIVGWTLTLLKLERSNKLHYTTLFVIPELDLVKRKNLTSKKSTVVPTPVTPRPLRGVVQSRFLDDRRISTTGVPEKTELLHPK